MIKKVYNLEVHWKIQRLGVGEFTKTNTEEGIA